jgi:hypothetical protein
MGYNLGIFHYSESTQKNVGKTGSVLLQEKKFRYRKNPKLPNFAAAKRVSLQRKP